MTKDDVDTYDMLQLLSIWRNTPVGVVDNEVMEYVGQRIQKLRNEDFRAFVSASKAVGWS